MIFINEDIKFISDLNRPLQHLLSIIHGPCRRRSIGPLPSCFFTQIVRSGSAILRSDREKSFWSRSAINQASRQSVVVRECEWRSRHGRQHASLEHGWLGSVSLWDLSSVRFSISRQYRAFSPANATLKGKVAWLGGETYVHVLSTEMGPSIQGCPCPNLYKSVHGIGMVVRSSTLLSFLQMSF